MSRFIDWIPACAGMTLAIAVAPALAGAQFPGIGRTATPAEIAAWDIDVRPDFKGRRPARERRGRAEVWDTKCASCHGTFGESNEASRRSGDHRGTSRRA